MNTILMNATKSWKSNVSGLLTVSLSTTTALLAVPSIQTIVSPKTLMILGGFQAVGKVWVSLITQDADKVLATVPGSATPVVVSAHAVPDNPAATPVIASKPEEAKP